MNNILYEVVKEEAKQLNLLSRISDKGYLIINSPSFVIVFSDDNITALHDNSGLMHVEYSQYSNLAELIETLCTITA